MQLKQQDVKTLESYKKAMKMAAGQIRDDTKFCIYNEVLLPDAGGKMHVLKPFLVVGSGQMTFKPLLPLLKGARKLVCEGLCAVHEGKVILKSDKVPFAQMGTQATFFKELLGGKPLAPAVKAQPSPAPIPVPAPKPAAPASQTATPVPPAPRAAEPHPVRLAKASTAWHGTRSMVDGTCQQLKQAIRAHYGKSHPDLIREIESNMHKIDTIVDRLDHTLAVSLKKASAAPTDTARAAELRVARGILNQYIVYVKAEPLIGQIDRNPFGVKCNLRQVLASSLTQMSQTITA